MSYKTEGPLLDGVLYIPREMEHKWAIFYHQKKIIFVRSWTREVLVTADVEQRENELIIRYVRGSFYSEDESAELSAKVLDYLIRSHVLDIVTPVPLESEPVDLHSEAVLCFTRFGKNALIATHESYEPQELKEPLRSHSLLHIAVAKGQLDTLKEFKELGVSFDTLAADGLAPLHWSLAQDDMAIVDYLLDNGANVDSLSHEAATPLMNACQARNINHVNYLLGRGANANAKDSRGFTSLHRAAEMGEMIIVKSLIENGAQVDVDAEGHTPLSLAEQRGEKKMIKLLTAHI